MKKKKFRLANFTLFAIFVDLCVIAALVVINNAEFKAFWIPTAMTTMSHKYLAYTLYDVDTVNKIMSENYIEQNTEKVNTGKEFGRIRKWEIIYYFSLVYLFLVHSQEFNIAKRMFGLCFSPQ